MEPGVKGNTASGKVTKPATIEGGYVLPVPLFINEGDVIRINTETGEYNDRTATKYSSRHSVQVKTAADSAAVFL